MRLLGPMTLMVLVGLTNVTTSEARVLIDFEKQVLPLLEKNCSSCHSAAQRKSGLVLETLASLVTGGALNGPAVIAGKPAESPLMQYLKGEKTPVMPMGLPPLPQEQIALIKKWIEQLTISVDSLNGTSAPWPFIPVKEVFIPSVRQRDWVRNPIDALVLEKLEQRGMHPAPPASQRVLLRRIYFDLLGIPPTPEEMQEFLRDERGDAYEKQIEKLLRDPRYGERWGRHWLDIVRYADSEGGGPDFARPHIWRYRDYVIRAFNQDRPYDRFIKEQLAGDAFPVYGEEGTLGLGFLHLGVVGEDSPRSNLLDDLVSTTGAVFLGLTLECAKCHDHKYDPILARDYYQTEAFFASLTIGEKSLPFSQYEAPKQNKASWEKRATAWQQEIAQRKKLKEETYTKLLNRLEKPFFIVMAQDLKDSVVPLTDSGDLKNAMKEGFLFNQQEKDLYTLITRQNASYGNVNHPDFYKSKVHTAWENQGSSYSGARHYPAIPTTYLLKGGNRDARDERVDPAFLSAIKFKFGPQLDPSSKKTRRQLLAEWVAHPDNPLTSRVMVNRIWQHHFGEGLVRTASDFGRNGSGTLHPQLIDFLASYFVKNRWSVKALHRLILQANIYQQSVRNPYAEEYQKVDPDNRYFWRWNPLRLEAEAIRDSILAVSGQMNPARGGPGFFAKVKDELLKEGGTWWKASKLTQRNRRTIYMWQGRSFQLPMINVFDGANMNESCWTREVTTVTPQVFALFNNEFVHEQSHLMAERIIQEVGTKTEKQLDRAFQLALQRNPTASEKSKGLRFLSPSREVPDVTSPVEASHTSMSDFCLVLFNMNEFIFVE